MAAVEPWADTDPRPVPENKLDVPTFVRANYFIAGSATILVGLVFIGREQEAINAADPCTTSCIGPSLAWSDASGTFTIAEINDNWRRVFSLAPSILVENWTPVFFGLVSVVSHLPGFQFAWVTRTWLHCAGWNIFLALFGHLGYGGNLGVLFGTYAIIVGFMCLFMQFSPWKNERPYFHVSFNGMLDRFSFMADNDVVHGFTKGLALFCGLMTIIVGFVHVLTRNFNWCPAGTEGTGTNPYNQCFGPSLRWNNGGAGQDFLADANGFQGEMGLGQVLVPGAGAGFRSVFSFNPEVFLPLWGPIILGVLMMQQHFSGRRWQFYSSWPRVCLVWLFVGLFGNLGYAGSLGVIVGFLSCLVSLLALLIAIGGGNTSKTSFEISVDLQRGG